MLRPWSSARRAAACRRRAKSKKPGRLGNPAGPEAWAFHAQEFNAAVAFWAASGIPGEKDLNDRQDTRQACTSISEQET